MYLRIQEDLHQLFQEYPIRDYSIRIKEGKQNFSEHTYINLFHEDFNIFSEENRIYLIDNTSADSELKVNLDGLEKHGIINDNSINFGKYEYGEDGIQVIDIFKKTKQDEGLAREIPIMLNGHWLVDRNWCSIKKDRKIEKIQRFYDDIEKFGNHYEGIRKQLRFLDRLELDDIFKNASQLSSNDDMLVFYSYYQQSQSDYFASQYFKIIDSDPQSFNFDKILENAKNLGILKGSLYTVIAQDLDNFRDSDNIISKYRNKYGAHHDKGMFHKYNKSERSSIRGIQQTRSIIEPSIFREKLKELMNFIDKTINENFSPQISFGNGGGHSEKQFILKIFQKN